MTMKREESCIEKETHKYIALCHTLIYVAMNSKNHIMNFNLDCNACFSVYCIFHSLHFSVWIAPCLNIHTAQFFVLNITHYTKTASKRETMKYWKPSCDYLEHSGILLLIHLNELDYQELTEVDYLSKVFKLWHHIYTFYQSLKHLTE